MPLVITCSKCGRKYTMSEDERKVFYKVIKTKEQLEQVTCSGCSKTEKEN